MSNRIVILGGGLAGSFMAARLCRAGASVSLIDEPVSNSASNVAAGLFNVITGRYGAKSWQAEVLLQEIRDFFSIPEFRSLQKYVHYLPIYRVFKEEAEYNKWLGRSADPAFRELVSFQERPLHPEQIINPHGGVMILPCGWVDISAMLKELKGILRKKWGLDIKELQVSYEQIDLERQNILIGGETQSFDHLILATGYTLSSCPWLPGDSIIPNKGEILLLESSDLDLPFVLSKKVYFIPIGNHQFISGSTYANTFEHDRPTEANKTEILTYIEKAIHVPVQVVDHWAGIRPTTRNRRPIIGTHPDYPILHVLGGFGTKGVLMAPYSSRILTSRILGQQIEIPSEADLLRLFQRKT